MIGSHSVSLRRNARPIRLSLGQIVTVVGLIVLLVVMLFPFFRRSLILLLNQSFLCPPMHMAHI